MLIFSLLLCPLKLFALETEAYAPDFNVITENSHYITLSQFQGNVVYLDFWASWCSPCKKSLPWMDKIQKKYAQQGLVILALNLDTKKKDANKLLASKDYSFQVAYDPKGETAEMYSLNTMPSSYLIDRNGKLKKVFKGFNESDKDQIEQEIQNLLSQEK